MNLRLQSPDLSQPLVPSVSMGLPSEPKGPHPSPDSSQGVAKADRSWLSFLRQRTRLLVAGGLVLGGLYLLPSFFRSEFSSTNWRHHDQIAARRDASTDSPPVGAKWVDRSGMAEFRDVIVVSADDRDPQTTTQVRQALRSHQREVANQLVLEAQSGLVKAGTSLANSPGSSSQQPVAPQPRLTSGMEAAFSSDRAEFYHILLRDSCHEDGDIVDVVIDGEAFARVPITNQGAMLSIPVSMLSTTQVSIRGVVDGGGGITVACTTSRGEGFMRVLQPGEEQPLIVMRQP